MLTSNSVGSFPPSTQCIQASEESSEQLEEHLQAKVDELVQTLYNRKKHFRNALQEVRASLSEGQEDNSAGEQALSNLSFTKSGRVRSCKSRNTSSKSLFRKS